MYGRPAAGTGRRATPAFASSRCPALVVQALKAWRAQQAADQLAWGRDWTDTGRVFTREDGTAVPASGYRNGSRCSLTVPGFRPCGSTTCATARRAYAKAAGLDSKYIAALLGHCPELASPTTSMSLVPGGREGRR